MSLSKFLHIVRKIVHMHADDCNAFVQVHTSVAGVVREGVARGLFRSRRAFYIDAPEHSAVRLSPAGLRWCRLHPEPKRKMRVWRRA